jgi:hypothetical protein
MILLIFCLTFHLVLCLDTLMDLATAYMVLIYKRILLCLDTFLSTHILIVVLVPHVDTVFRLEVPTITLR